jgi:hypothetical protein
VQVQVSVGGMTCSMCAGAVEDVVKKVRQPLSCQRQCATGLQLVGMWACRRTWAPSLHSGKCKISRWRSNAHAVLALL